MKKSDILQILKKQYPHVSTQQLKLILNATFDAIGEFLKTKGRTEIRGIGTFRIKHVKPKIARNPKTGEKIFVDGKKTVYYKMSKVLKRQLFS